MSDDPRMIMYEIICPVCDHEFRSYILDGNHTESGEYGRHVFTHIALCGLKGGDYEAPVTIHVPVRLDKQE